ncbi:ubiquitin carboxyl-terminal hydrolase 20-like isoform X2 [Halichondria panicea]|uniref:ubiquitin carboxyl-terminal hydrolase 20-like isoform X2 n=1 Tax=Halichondria panicea TaxID=6063 RepID=UPI00312B9298
MEKITRALPGTPLQHAKASGSSEDPRQTSRTKRETVSGLVGLVNVGNSCYMNATLQALSNCPPFRQYFIDCHPGSTHNRAADCLSNMFRQMWTSERHPGHLSPRKVSSVMKNKIFKGVLQQDAQEFLRCLLSQIHEEIGLLIPGDIKCGCGKKSCDCCHRDSMMSCISHDSNVSNDSSSKLVRSASGSPVTLKRKPSSSPTFNFKRKGSYSKLKWGSKSSLEKVHLSSQQGDVEGVAVGVTNDGSVRWEEGEVFLVDLDTGLVTLHSLRVKGTSGPDPSSDKPQTDTVSSSGPTNQSDTVVVEQERKESMSDCQQLEPIVEVKGQDEATADGSTCVDPSGSESGGGVVLREKPAAKKVAEKPRIVSIVSQVFEGVLESKVTCLSCKKVSVIHEPFHDLSLSIPGRKEMNKFSRKPDDSCDGGDQSEESSRNNFKQGFCSVFSYVSTFTRDLFVGPPTDLQDCLNAFFDACELKGDNKYFCTHCKSFQNSRKQTSIIKLPDVLCIHLKRFKFDAYFSTKISRNITFPLTDLEMGGYLREGKGRRERYNLDAVINHIGGAGGGHYIAFARNGGNNSWYEFNDTKVRPVSSDTVQHTEGYVLFYRRVPPTDSFAAQPVDTVTLLPKQGTTLPSPDVCYLSRHWLHLAKHCSHPGPIFQHKYACHHGSVVHDEVARQSSMAVRREVWDRLQSKYGGGPLVSTLDPCILCQEKDLFVSCPYNLEQLNAKRNREKDKIHQIEKTSNSKTEPFLLSMDWVNKWKSFIQCNTLDVLPPGPIDNTPLLELGGADHTYKMADADSYRKMSSATWSYFHQHYGGGPVITTSLTALNPESTV